METGEGKEEKMELAMKDEGRNRTRLWTIRKRKRWRRIGRIGGG